MRFDPTIIIIDGASAKAQPLARAVRALGFFSLVFPATAPLDELKKINPAAIILARGEVAPSADLLSAVHLVLDEHENFQEDNFPKSELDKNPHLFWPAPKDLKAHTLSKLAHFFLITKKLIPTFTVDFMIATSIEAIKTEVGPDGKVILGLSGGVDSSVSAALIHKAIGDRLLSFFVDHGLMRAGEAEEVETMFRSKLGLNLESAKLEDLFLGNLKGVTDPEQKRKIIGRVFVEVFEAEAKKRAGINFLGQGTIYPDIIESISPAGGGAPVKSHHNVGGLPERLNLKLLEPLKFLFKDEVRAIGLKLGLDPALINRQPFPGPGLGVRCLGEITKDRLELLRKADLIVRHRIETSSHTRPWQFFAVLLPVKSVGVKNDARVYGEVVAIRAINTTDAMTAGVADFPMSFLTELAADIIEGSPGLSRVVYDISPKPPATIEWE